MIHTIKRACSLFGRCWRSLILFEIFYRLCSAFVILPLCRAILLYAIKISKIYTMNPITPLDAFQQPAVMMLNLLAGVILTVAMMFEIICLIICFYQAHFHKELNIFRLMGMGIIKTVQCFLPSNIIIFFMTMLLVPCAKVFLLCEPIRELDIPAIYESALFSVFPKDIFIPVLMILFTILVSLTMMSYYYFVLEHKNGFTAIIESIKLSFRKIYKSIFLIEVWAIFVIFGAFAIDYYIQALQSLLEMMNIYAELTIIKYITTSIGVFTFYSLLTSAYFSYKKSERQVLPKPFRIKKRFAFASRPTFTYASIAVLSFFLLTGNIMSLQAVESIPVDQVMLYENTSITAHRGDSSAAPENTLPAIQKAIEEEAAYVEVDVQETLDGAVIVLHDATLASVTGTDWNVWEKTLEQIKTLDATAKFGKEYKGNRIATLDEVLQQCKGKIKVNIELKDNGHGKKLAESTLQIINDNDMEEECIIQSFSYHSLERVKELNPDMLCGYLIAEKPDEYLLDDNIDFFNIESNYITEETVNKVHSVHKKILAWTVNSEDEIERLIRLHVDSIITDTPKEAMNKLNEIKAELNKQ